MSLKATDSTRKIVVSRDVVFDEGTQWNWNPSYKEELIVDTESGETEINNEFEEESAVHSDSSDEEEGNQTQPTETEAINEGGGRNRHPPGWMRDYATG